MLEVRKKNFKETTKTLFLKYTVIPIFILIVLFSVFTFFVFKIKLITDTHQSANNIVAEILDINATYTKEIDRMSKLSSVINTLNQNGKNHLVYEEFYNFNNQQDVKGAFHLVDKRNVFLASTIPSNSEINEKIINEIIPRIAKNPDELYTDAFRSQFSNGKETVVTIGKAIIQENETIGYILYQLYEEDMQRLIFGEKADIVIVTDQYDYIIASTNSIVVGLMNKFIPEKVSNSRVKIKNDVYYMIQKKTPDELFSVYTLKNVKNDSLVIFIYFIFIVLTIVMLFFLLKNLAERMSAKNTEAIDKLVAAVSRLEKGDMKSYVNIDTGDEFEVLANEYNSMLDNLNELIEKNKELSNIRRVTEIKLLQSQFNPHFLFNVLETLRYTIFVNIDEAQEIIFSLSRLLRYSIKNEVQHVTFEKDLNYTVDYLKLHKFRFGKRLEYQIDVDEDLKKIFIPKLLLQPLIENAIKYGYQKQTHLMIKIKGQVSGDEIKFTVTDNGGGIEAKKLQQIKDSLTVQDETTRKTGIGLYSTHRRIILQYGVDFGLMISNSNGNGTKVEIRMPFDEGADEDV